MTRNQLPAERRSITRKTTIAGIDVYLIIGEYKDGTPGEIRIRVGKQGSEDGVYGLYSDAVSWGLQYGLPLEFLVEQHMYQHMVPCGETTDGEFPTVKSIVDWVMKVLEARYLPERKEAREKEIEKARLAIENELKKAKGE